MDRRLLACVAGFGLLSGCDVPAAPIPRAGRCDVPELIAQLDGLSCRYSYRLTCQLTASWPWPLLRLQARSAYECRYAAASCLETLGEEASPAVPALLTALRDGPNDFDTGDGLIGTRSAIANALAATRDPRGIDALADAVRHAVPQDRSSGRC